MQTAMLVRNEEENCFCGLLLLLLLFLLFGTEFLRRKFNVDFISTCDVGLLMALESDLSKALSSLRDSVKNLPD